MRFLNSGLIENPQDMDIGCSSSSSMYACVMVAPTFMKIPGLGSFECLPWRGES